MSETDPATPTPTTPATSAPVAPVANPAAAPASPQPGTPTPPTITIADLPQGHPVRNQIEAENKRGLQQQLVDAQAKIDQSAILQTQVSELMGALPKGVEVGDVADNVLTTLNSMKTEQEKLEAANKSQADKLTAANDLADKNLLAFQNARKLHEFSVNAGPKAVSKEAADLIAMHLEARSEVAADGTVTVKMDVTDPETKHVEKDKPVSVEVAVALMEQNVTAFGTLFKATQNSGTGGTVVDGVARTSNGELDLKALASDPAKFLEMSKTNPGLLAAAAQAAMNGQ